LGKGYRWRIGFSMSPAFAIAKSPILPILLGLVICLISTANFGGVLEILQAQYAEGSRLGRRRPVRNPRRIDTLSRERGLRHLVGIQINPYGLRRQQAQAFRLGHNLGCGRSNPRRCGPVGDYRLDQITGFERCMAMRKTVLLLSMMSCAFTGADARGRHHHGHHFDMYLQALPGADTPSGQRQSTRRSGRERLAVVAPTDPAERSIDTAQIVPRDWNLESPGPNRNGQRFVSPDGTAWFEWYRVAAGDKSVAAHM
jgi:hypothetical protein